MADRADSYDVGYKKPPQSTRFITGRSGNPNGRPKGTKNLANLIFKIGRERIRVTSNGRTRTITKLEAILLQLMNKAVSGEDRAAKEVLHLHNLFENAEQTSIPPAESDEREEAVMKNMLRRIREIGEESDPDNDPVIPDETKETK